MMEIPGLDPFYANPDPIIVNKAKRIAQIAADYKEGHLTTAEFNELTANELDYDQIAAAVEDEDRRIRIRKAFEEIKAIVEVLSSVVKL